MLQIHSKYSESIKDIFQNDQEFLSALDKACSTAINHRINPKLPCRSPELVNELNQNSSLNPKHLISLNL